MNQYKYDLHIHTREVSPCGHVPGRELVRLYHEIGVSGLVITDHYSGDSLSSLAKAGHQERMDHFLAGYQAAHEEGERLGMIILPGLELRFLEDPNDYLIYGADEAFLMDNPLLHHLDLLKFRRLIAGRDMLIIQAHPYRFGISPADPALLDGVEVFNGNPRQNSRNDLALTFAQKNNLIGVSGSDFHQLEDLGRGGTIFSELITNPAGLVKALREKKISGLIGA